MGNVTRESTPETLGPNPQLGKRYQRLWEQIRNSGNDTRGAGNKSATRETMPEALGTNPRSGNRRPRRWDQIRNSGNDARGAGSKSAIRETAPEALGTNPRSGKRRKTQARDSVKPRITEKRTIVHTLYFVSRFGFDSSRESPKLFCVQAKGWVFIKSLVVLRPLKRSKTWLRYLSWCTADR